MRLCLTALVALLVMSAQLTAQQTSHTPSLQETLDYVNSKFVDSRNYKDAQISVSGDHETIILDCNTVGHSYHQQYRAVAIELDPSSTKWGVNLNEDYLIQTQCKNGIGCVDWLHPDGSTTTQRQIGVFPYPPDEEIGKRLVKAYTHLVELLQAEYRSKHDKDDPFAK
jgi:hypothetical protein